MGDSQSFSARVLHSPRLGFGAATAALVALASSGTGLLVAHGTNQLQPPAPNLETPQSPSPAGAPVVVDRAPGSLALPPALLDGTARAIHRALTAAPRTTRRTVTAPLVPAAPPEVVVVVPPVVPPVVVPPPVLDPDVSGSHGKGHHAHSDNGKHLGQLKH